MVERRPKAIQLVLVLHTAVDYVYAQGVGISLVQRAECATTGIIKNDIIQTEERKYSIKRENFTVENIKTPNRALMLALLHALGLARGTIKRHCSKTVQLQEVTIHSSSPAIIQIVNHHIKHAPKSLEDVASTNDRSMIKRVVAGVRKLSHYGLKVSIAVFGTEDETGKTARTMARQRGRKACRSRRQLRLASDDTSTEAQHTVGDEAALEGTLEPPYPMITPSTDTKHEEPAKHDE
jgi:predicted MarR family transcription regulator